MKKLIIFAFLFLVNCSSNNLGHPDKEVVKVQSSVSPTIGKLVGETSAGLLFLAYDLYGYVNFNLNKKEINLHTDATYLALNYGKNGEFFSWHSNERMSSGKTKVIASYYRDQSYCRIIQSLINLNGASKHKTYNLCFINKQWVYN